MKTLIIKAHPSSLGFTHKIAQSYYNALIGSGISSQDIDIIDLYKEKTQDYLRFESPKDLPKDDIKTQYQEKIIWAEHIVFIHPLWWGSMPAILKNFIDCNFSAGFAFKYQNGRPVGLLAGRMASVYITCDGPMWAYRILGVPFKRIWSDLIFRTVGLKPLKFRVLDKKFKRKDAELGDFLNKVEGDAKSSVLL